MCITKKYLSIIVSAFALLTLTTPNKSFAVTTSGTLGVSATVAASCTVGGGTLSFGSYSPTSTSDLTANTSFSLQCVNGTSYSIKLNNGLNFASNRRMLNSQQSNTFLNYELYTSSNFSSVWNSSNFISGIGNGNAENITVYGKIFANQNSAMVGSYSDLVTITVTF